MASLLEEMMASFSEKFRDPRWFEKRKKVLEECGGQCQECGSTENLDVHICWFESGREPWEYPDAAYVCLCRQDSTERKNIEKEIRQDLAAFGYESLDTLHHTLKLLASLQRREVAMEQVYVTAKKARFAEESLLEAS